MKLLETTAAVLAAVADGRCSVVARGEEGGGGGRGEEGGRLEGGTRGGGVTVRRGCCACWMRVCADCQRTKVMRQVCEKGGKRQFESTPKIERERIESK